MGQRTAILLKKNFGNNRSTITLIHHQWGIGKAMPSMFIQEVLKLPYPMDRTLSYISESKLKADNKLPIDYFFTFEPLNNTRDNYITNKEVATDNPDEDIWRSEVRIRYGNMTDNNNGLMLVEVTQNYDNYGEPINYGSNMLSIKVGFALGSEEVHFWHDHLEGCVNFEPEFDRLVSMEEYVCRTFTSEDGAIEKYSKEFVKSCRTIMKLADITEVYQKGGKAKRDKKEKQIRTCLDVLTKDLADRQTIPVPVEFQEVETLYK